MRSDTRVAQRLFWCLLVLSMAFNAAVAFLVPTDTNPYVVALVHAVYPAMFAVSETLLVRVPKLRNRAADCIRLICATGSALAAVAGSAKNLALLAELAGAGGLLKWTLPLVLDLPTCLAMLSTVYAADPDLAKQTTDQALSPLLEPVGAERPALATSEPVTPQPTPLKGSTTKPTIPVSETSKPVAVRRSGSVSSDDVAAALREDSSLTANALGDRFGVSAKTIGRTAAWKTRKTLEGVAV